MVNMQEADLLKKLRAAFRTEAGERLSSFFSRLEAYQRCADKAGRLEQIEVLFREAHSLKGAARAVNFSEIENFCQTLESVFAFLRDDDPEPGDDLLTLLYDSAAWLEKLVFMAEERPGEELQLEHQRLLQQLEMVADSLPAGRHGGSRPSPACLPAGTAVRPVVRATSSSTESAAVSAPRNLGEFNAGSEETLRIAAGKLDQLGLVSEEFVLLKLLQRQYLQQMKGTLGELRLWEKARDELAREIKNAGKQLPPIWRERLSGALNRRRQQGQGLARQLQGLLRKMEDDRRFQANLIDELRDRVRDLAMLPLAGYFAPFSRMVRELAGDLGKKIEFVFVGGLIEVDRRVLEEMRDPLIHLLRNAVDHGLEDPAERLVAGKSEKGTIRCRVLHADASGIELEVSDDGRGLDPEKLRRQAEQAGLIESDTELGEAEVFDLIFASGLSTSSIITEISGRGLGMAIVREKIENLGGRIEVFSQPGRGTRFRLHLPVSVAVSRGIRVLCGGREMIFPSFKVERVLLVDRRHLRQLEGVAVLMLEEQVLPLLQLAPILGLEEDAKAGLRPENELHVVVVGHGRRRRGLVVDEVLGEQEMLSKSLGPQLKRVLNVEGATILGSGKVVPILNVGDLLSSSRTASVLVSAEEVSPPHLLVVDDSITSRMLLQNILEAAGYRVSTAVDGQAALQSLRKVKYDLLVSDVEMPRLDGFALTAALRMEDDFQDLPVILVTSLGSREDRERGVAAGADAYIVKGEFDQNNLLDVVRRLL